MIFRTAKRVLFWPVQSLFPYPSQPAFSFTDKVGKLGPEVQEPGTVSDIDTNALVDCMHLRTKFVPHNNKVNGKPPVHNEDFYNTNHPLVAWDELTLGGRLKYMSDVLLVPWVKSVSGTDTARAIQYGYLMTDSGQTSRNNYVAAASVLSLQTTMNGQGFWLSSGIQLDPIGHTWTQNTGGEWTSADVYPTNTTALPYYDVAWQVTGSNQPPTTYVLRFYSSGFPVLYKTTDTYVPGDLLPGVKVREIRPTNNAGEQVMGQGSYGYYGYYGWGGSDGSTGKFIDVRMIGGQIQISLNALDSPAIIIHNVVDDPDLINYKGNVDFKITQINIYGWGIKDATIALHPMKFVQNAVYTSRPYNMGFVPQNDPTISVHYAWAGNPITNPIPNTSAIVTWAPDSENSVLQKYQMSLFGTKTGTYGGKDYCDFTPCVRAVTASFAEILSQPYGTPIEVYPKSVSVGHDFRIDNLSVVWKASLTFHNVTSMNQLYGADIYWGEWMMNTGMVGVTIDLMTEGYPDDDVYGPPIYSTGWVRVFTGYGGEEESVTVGIGDFVMRCSGRESAGDNPMLTSPWFDGWNIYAAGSYLFQRMGVKKGDISDSQLTFRQYVPDDPYEDAGFQPADGKTYFLGQGTGGSPLYRYSGNTIPWKVMDDIFTRFGIMRGFDNLGNAVMIKYSAQGPTAPLRTFFPNDTNIGDRPGNVVMGNVSKSLKGVRSKLILVGLNPETWLRQASGREDPSIVYNQPGGNGLSFTQWNFLGFDRAAIWEDSMFADGRMVTDAIDATFPVLNAPGMDAGLSSPLGCQPDLFALMDIGVADRRSGLFDPNSGIFLRLRIFGVQHHINEAAGIFRTDLKCRFVP